MGIGFILQKHVEQGERSHGFHNRNRADCDARVVAAFDFQIFVGTCDKIHGLLDFGNGWSRFHRKARDDRHTVRYAAKDSATVITR